MFTKLTWLGVAVALVVAVDAAAEAKPNKYLGAKKCRTCHEKELIGDQYGVWLKGPHAGAFETLKSEKAAKLATGHGVSGPPHEAPECLTCHVTAYGVDASLIGRKPLLHADGVQCESCHGPGRNYRKKTVMADREVSIANGLWEPGKNAEVCTACHNDESPGWDSVKGFDFEAAKRQIAHPIPKYVKGHYNELEKKAKAESGSADDADDE